MQQNDFLRDSRAAVERMREMNSRSKFQDGGSRRMPPVPPFVKIPNGNANEKYSGREEVANDREHRSEPEQNTPPKTDGAHGSGGSPLLGLPFLNSLGKDSDVTLILGLLLILFSEKADKLLLFALVYILL